MSILNLGKVRPVLLGAYSEVTEYKFLNGVSYNGSYYFYINETASTGNLPTDTEYWAIAAQKGDKGDQGDPGPKGDQGPKGDKGDPGNLTGPASSVNENIPIFDGVGGGKLKDSGVKLSDKADVTYAEYLMMEGDPA